MSAPAPFTTTWPASEDAVPAVPTSPTSMAANGAGTRSPNWYSTSTIRQRPVLTPSIWYGTSEMVVTPLPLSLSLTPGLVTTGA